ncbi:XRE family transcriptional regulator [Agrobacterium rhizogenes]|nr:XRE family transcriptional regulator [Rhizobium rhizogenes]NTH97015.1 XRE family transcriptional regulator [Rhizobium rhizogenes]NTJ15201.1 XRE family transcriptional regulator [Rhizobium rhizogenes]
MKLHEYLNQADTQDEAEFASECEVSISCVRKWRYGDRFPRPRQLEKIKAATRGRVTANDFAVEVA